MKARLKFLILLPVMMLAGQGCGSKNPSSQPGAAAGVEVHQLAVQGKLLWKDGAAVTAGNTRYSVTLGGTGLFAEGQNGCGRSDPHMQGMITENVSSDSAGTYSALIPVDQAKSVTSPACGVGRVILNQLDMLRLTAEIQADEDSCTHFCSAEGGGSDCVSSCAEGDRVLLATKTLSQAELQSFVSSGSPDPVRIAQDLVFTREGPATSQGVGPDLAVDGQAITDSLHITREDFAATDCAIVEQCVGGPGKRTLLRFDGNIMNLGTAPLVLGSPIDNPQFEYSACHDHYHLKDIMLYELLDSRGSPVKVNGARVVGRKQGFCMMDINTIGADAGDSQYTCDIQGLSAGWEDSYDSSLDCQWLDITGVPGGNYNLRVTVNPDHLFEDSDWNNDSVQIPVQVPAS